LGLAHECQKVDKLELASWDVPLTGIVTDGGWYGRRATESRSLRYPWRWQR